MLESCSHHVGALAAATRLQHVVLDTISRLQRVRDALFPRRIVFDAVYIS